MQNVFTTRDMQYHKTMKRSAGSVYSLTSLKAMESLVDKNTEQFVNLMKAKKGEPVDLSIWLQWYAFDAIGLITFLKSFDCTRNECDATGIIDVVDYGFRYGAVVGMMPWLHNFLLGSQYGAKLLSTYRPADHISHTGLVGHAARSTANC